MATRPLDPRRLGVEAFARDGGTLEGSEPLAAFPRLLAATHPDAPPSPEQRVAWRAHGELRRPQAVQPQPWLHLEASATLALVCQRCLEPIEIALEVDRWMRFVHTEDEAAALDAEIEEDVLALDRPLDLPTLVEDELLLALPLVPRHAVCPRPLSPPAEEAGAEVAPHPFAGLAALKGRGRDDG